MRAVLNFGAEDFDLNNFQFSAENSFIESLPMRALEYESIMIKCNGLFTNL